MKEEAPDWYVFWPDYDKIVSYVLEIRGSKPKMVDMPALGGKAETNY